MSGYTVTVTTYDGGLARTDASTTQPGLDWVAEGLHSDTNYTVTVTALGVSGTPGTKTVTTLCC